MRIKRLEIHGFKSFADRTVLHFGDGITGVVGPNGCGKSNIVDALRWAMGEQSAKHLRGAGMEDVIFAGSESRGPMGMSEVTITFKNDGFLVPPEYKGMSEISVTRRLFRDGTSEYLINKQLARLRDVTDLFLGTGIGTKSYSIIEQGRIGLIVTAKPEDRRSLIEDAAGITKYKARRKQAERRLEAAEANLLRVTDIVGELKKRIGSLERQAKKAERYRALKGELKALDLWSAAHRHLELIALEGLEQRGAEAAAEILNRDEAALESEEQRVRTEVHGLDAREREVQIEADRLAAIEQTLAVGAKNVEHLERELTGLLERRHDAERELEMLRAQRVEAQQELEELERTTASLDETSGVEVDALQSEESALQELSSVISEREDALERKKRVVVDCLTSIAQHESKRAALERAAAEIDQRVTKKQGEANEATRAAKEAERSAAEAKRRLDENRQIKLQLEDKRVEQELLLEKLQGEFMDNEAKLLGLRGELMDKRSRYSSLLEIQKNYEGCQQSVRAIMRQAKETPSIYKRLHGLVADVISAPPRFETAVEAVLGDRLQYIIVDDQREGLASIDFLKHSADGRSSFIPLDLREDHVSWAPRKSTRLPARRAAESMIHGPAIPVARAHAALSMIGEAMIAQVDGAQVDGAHVDGGKVEPEAPRAEGPEKRSISDRPPPPEVQELADALQQGLIKEKPKADVAASLLPYPDLIGEEEDVWPNPHLPGMHGKLIDLVSVSAGYEPVARVLLGDVAVVEDLDAARAAWQANGHRKTLVTLSGEVLDPVGILSGGSNQGASTGLLTKKREIQELGAQVEALETQVRVLEDRHGKLELRIGQIEDAVRDLSREGHQEDLSIVKLEQDLRSVLETAARHSERAAEIVLEIEQILGERAELDAEADRSESAMRDLETRRAEIEAEVADQLVELGALKQESGALSERVTQLKVAVASSQEKREHSRRSLHRTEARLAEIDARVERLSGNISASEDEAARIRENITDGSREKIDLEADAIERRAHLTNTKAALEIDLATLRADEDRLRELRRTLEGVRSERAGALLRLREQQLAREALHQQIEERYQINLWEVIGDHHLSAPQAEEHLERRDDLRKKIEAMGEINLTAIEEYQEVKERYDFLSAQKADLESAIGMLKAAIKKINRTSRDRYVQTFDLVNEKFQLVFPRLFNGGRASLVLSDPSDPLESGIEMLAQPPGKKLQSVTLLSGGEKALTAVALVFGIFLIKPTPFCLLDEVDAPLDDANVGRYNELVRDMSQISQFILITHNKRTMELPDRLYGVTMEEPGISKLVAVDIRSTEQHLRLVS
ncbi:MAG: chromosome segregation protein SMC [Deltaproteobacteria bacterium]|nr:chromosome segregation protein SMC [Deltaproteobacteria bacterium]